MVTRQTAMRWHKHSQNRKETNQQNPSQNLNYKTQFQLYTEIYYSNLTINDDASQMWQYTFKWWQVQSLFP
jgi:hypothetical protein